MGDSSSDFSLSDEEDMPASYRDRRIEELKAASERARLMKELHHGELSEIKDEPKGEPFKIHATCLSSEKVMQTVVKVKKAVVHFYHPDFRRCAIMNDRLTKLAEKHFETLFLKVDVADVPFLVSKLEIKILPCVISFVDGITQDRIIGFEGLSIEEGDSFTLGELEARLGASGVLADKRSV